MKLSVIAAALLIMTTSEPAAAYGDHANFDCGNNIEASTWKNNVTVTLPEGRQDEPFTLRATTRKLFVNGRRCVFLTDRMYLKRECLKGS